MPASTDRFRLTAGASLIAATALIVASLLSGTVSGVEPGDAPPGPIQVVQELQDPGEVPCETFADAVSVEYVQSPEPVPFGSWKVVITVDAPLCDPVAAVAAAYQMPPEGTPWPDDWWEAAQSTWWPNFFPPLPPGLPQPPKPSTSYAWPQVLQATEDFTLDAPGVTTITFAQECDPLQFDVIRATGQDDTPEVIDPTTAQFHSPLLFAPTYGLGAGGSALQYWPPSELCTPPPPPPDDPPPPPPPPPDDPPPPPPPPPPPDDETTTTSTPPTIVTIPATIDVAAFAPVCQGDIPYIEYDIRVSGTSATTATITFFDLDGNEVEVLTDVPLSGRVIYPGASESPQDWPGWVLNSEGLWVPDPTDDRLRDGLTITVEVNPTASAQVSYPPATAACNSPENPDSNPPGSAPPGGRLPFSGVGTPEGQLRFAG